jgi:formylglycine-generating enzyme required for sulfatase activity
VTKKDMVSIPAGDFDMGLPDGVGETIERPQRRVHVDAFEMDVTEVTVAAYEQCVHAGACKWSGTSGSCNDVRVRQPEAEGGVTASHPVNCADWNDANAYCTWAGKRLPTEEEWEYAARGTDGRTYPWGNEAPSNQLCWLQGQPDVKAVTCPVGSFPTGDSPFGLHDMAGNVNEWTSSGYSDSYASPRSATDHVIRGGPFMVNFNSRRYLRATFRMHRAEWNVPDQFGFRCAR